MSLPDHGAVTPRRLLIVGDVALSRGLMRMVLSRLGYVVTCVASGQEAVAGLQHTRFALALIALQLPDLPGFTLARRLRATPGPIGGMPILLFGSAWDQERIHQSCREAGIEGFLPKPVALERLVATIRHLTSRPSHGAEIVSEVRSPIDGDQLSSFTAGDPRLERELGELYLRTAGTYLADMRRALAGAGDWRGSAHALKGASANFGAPVVAALAAAAEHEAPSGERLVQLEQAVDAVAHGLAVRSSVAEPSSVLAGSS